AFEQLDGFNQRLVRLGCVVTAEPFDLGEKGHAAAGSLHVAPRLISLKCLLVPHPCFLRPRRIPGRLSRAVKHVCTLRVLRWGDRDGSRVVVGGLLRIEPSCALACEQEEPAESVFEWLEVGAAG